jgi:hypothetical protein
MRLLMHGADLKDKLMESSTNINREAKHVTIAANYSKVKSLKPSHIYIYIYEKITHNAINIT